MTRTLLLLAATTALASCVAPVVSPTPVAAPDASPAPAAPRPQYGSFGFDADGMDRTVLPGDNFYEFANGAWARNTPIPADKSSYGLFTVLDDLSRQRTRAILEEQAAIPSSKIGVAYNSYLDTAAIEAKGLAPFNSWLGRIAGIGSRAGYAAVAAQADRIGIPTPINVGVGQDNKQPDRYVPRVSQGGLGLPDRDYYLSPDPKMVDIRAKYVAHLTRMLALAGQADAARRAQAVFDFEARIAKAHWTRVESRDAIKIYNLMDRAALAAGTRGFDMAGYLAGLGIDQAQVIVAQPSAVAAIARLLGREPLAVLKDQLLLRSLASYAHVLPKAFDDERFSFAGTVLSGTPQQEERWKRAVTFTTGALGDEVSKIYVARHFTPETKAAADALVKNVVEAMGRRIDGLPWMAPETKVRARAKLANFKTKIGYPDRWKDYASLEIRPGDALGNAMRAEEWAHADSVSKLGAPIRRWEWGMAPMTVNAYANATMQEIVFPAAILQPPFFDPNADPAINYGGIGAVIGHEISHHFDDQGAKYDENGRLNEWWTPADRAAFEAAGKALIAQYDAYEPLPGRKMKGALALGENIGDLAGLTVAYDAYRRSLGGQAAPILDGTTGDQRFYLGWAQVWRRNYREASLLQQLVTGPHSPSEQRAWVVRNLDPWYSAFDVRPGQKLYLAPEQRVRIW